jgi:hypothetical protein
MNNLIINEHVNFLVESLDGPVIAILHNAPVFFNDGYEVPRNAAKVIDLAQASSGDYVLVYSKDGVGVAAELVKQQQVDYIKESDYVVSILGKEYDLFNYLVITPEMVS